MTTSVRNNSVFRSFFEKQKLTGPNFIDCMWKTVNELHAMLKLHEETLPKKFVAPALHAIRAGKVQKNKNMKPSKAAKGVQGKAMGLRGSKKLNLRALSLYMGNGQCAAVKAIGNYQLCLPSRLVIVLNNYHYAPSITRGVISVSYLYEDGFINSFELNNAISVSKNNIVYFNAIPRDGVYEIEMSCSNTNDSSMYVVSNKRAKLNLDTSLLSHCRLEHISKKRIEKLQHDGLLNSFDIESLGKCVSCMSGKIKRKPYSHQLEKAKDLLGLIHTDVCVPFRIVSRQGANYFITFTDDFGRYGYVYLLKHKHKVLETFEVFQKEVENQFEKTIKSLRFDRREMRTKTLLDMVRSMMSQTTLLKSFWDYALESVACILNMVQTKKVDKTPYEIWHGQAPKLSYLKVWGCEALVKHDTLTKPNKLEPISFKCIFVGYPKEMMRYSFYNPFENEVFVSWNAEFFETALKDPEFKKWQAAMNVEIQSMKDNDVWELVELPPNAKTIGHKWLFKKTDMDGAVHTFKSHLVAKGFNQTYKVDYEETFSPVAGIKSIRILIAIATFYEYEIWQMGVKTAFLNGHLSEEVYMTHPKGFVNLKYPTMYASSRVLFMDLSKNLASGSYVTFLILYVDDILIMGNNIPMLQDVKSYLGKCFAMKDLGEAAYIFGIKSYRDRSKWLIGLCQSAYIEKILKRYYMENSKRGTIPMQEKLKWSKSDGVSTPVEKRCMSNIPYASTIVSIMYDVRCTRPDVAVSCYTNAGYLMDADNLKSQTRYVFVLNGGVVDWKITKQSISATSSIDAEYIATFNASKEAVWICKFISGINVVPIIKEPITMYCDNTGAITIENDHGVTKGTRHFHEKVHYL
nr:hypothetical protein [Tanacetum cinerariifolium]